MQTPSHNNNTDVIHVKKINEVHAAVTSSEMGLLHELADQFTFELPNARFTPSYKNKFWDGKVRLFSLKTKLFPMGLIPHMERWAAERDYELVKSGFPSADTPVLLQDIDGFIKKLNLPPEKQPRDYQIKSLLTFCNDKRAIVLSPTASGKSLAIYMMTMMALSLGHRVLITVPTINLVAQMRQDFLDYGCPDTFIYSITGGVSKESAARIIISTWQSCSKLNQQWFDKFGCVIGDEAHLYKADCLALMLSKMKNAEYRVGLTGTLDGKHVHRLQLEANFGPVVRVATTQELQARGLLSSININFIRLSYTDEARKHARTKLKAFPDEVNWLIENKNRNELIVKIAKSISGNSLFLFNHRDSHAKLIYERLLAELGEDRVHYITGSVDGSDREIIRRKVLSSNNAIIVGTYGCISTGVNIPNLNNAVFCAPGGKSVIRVLQSIGRVLRKAEGKKAANLIDLVDDLSSGAYKNHCIKHAAARMTMYSEQGWSFDKRTFSIT